MKNSLETLFRLSEHDTTPRKEISGGVVTFLTMSYIIFVQPAILSQAGMDFNAVMAATCISSGIASILMGLLANYPIALAPGMGENFFFAFTVVLMLGATWQQALGMVFLSGLLFVFLTLIGARERIITSIPVSLRHGITAGIGLFIAFIGLVDGGIITRNNSALKAIAFQQPLNSEGVLSQLDQYQYASGALRLGDLTHPAALLTLAGLFITLFLMVKGVRSAMLLGILSSTLLALLFGLSRWQGLTSAPPSLEPTLLQFSFKGIFSPQLIAVTIVFFIMDLFDTVGTLLGVSHEAGLWKSDKLPKANRAFMADAAGTLVGASLGTSTVTSFIESASGVRAGARTGLSACTTGLLFFAALFFSPLVAMVGAGCPAVPGGGLTLYPITAPILILVGLQMMRGLSRLDWDDIGTAIPAILTAIGIPLTYSIADGLALGFISHTLIQLVRGRLRDLNLVLVLVTILFMVRFLWIKL